MDMNEYKNQTIPGNVSGIRQFGTSRPPETWQTLLTAICLSPIIVLGVLGNIFSLLVWVKGEVMIYILNWYFNENFEKA